MTEEEAKTKWCPHARNGATGESDSTFNRFVAAGGEHYAETEAPCIGSRCMAWRWVDGPEDVFMGDPKLDGRLEKAEGYCGLAGPIS